MTIITLSSGACLPASALGLALAEALPRWRWTCGDDIDGLMGMLPWRHHQMISGRQGDEPLFLEMTWHAEPCAGPAPPHAAHLVLGRPTTEDPKLAERLLAIVAGEILRGDPGHAHVQFLRDGPWLDRAAMERLLPLVANAEPLSIAAGLAGVQPASDDDAANEAEMAPQLVVNAPAFDDLASRDRSGRLGQDAVLEAQAQMALARSLLRNPVLARTSHLGILPAFLEEVPRFDRLPTLVMLCDEPPEPDGPLLTAALLTLDPWAGWQVSADPDGIVARSSDFSIRLDWHGEPLPPFLVELALDRSYWCEAGDSLRRIRSHAGYLSITCDLDAEGGQSTAVRQAAKAMALTLAIAARSPHFAGYLNAATGCIWREQDIDRLIAALGADDVPLPLFVWTEILSAADDAVSMATSGLLPFAGREIETWNAPGSLEWVNRQLGSVMRSVLRDGPSIGHGDLFGIEGGSGAGRGFHSVSRGRRGDKVPVLLLEFPGPSGMRAISPRPGITPSRPHPGISAIALRAGGGFGRKGL